MIPTDPLLFPIIPAKAGTQVFYPKALSFQQKAWVPAFAGMIG